MQEQIKDIIIIRVLSVVRPLVACAACTEAREPLPRPARLLSVGRLEAEGHGQRMRAGQRAYPAWARHGGATITEDRLLWPLTRNGRSSWSFYCVSEGLCTPVVNPTITAEFVIGAFITFKQTLVKHTNTKLSA